VGTSVRGDWLRSATCVGLALLIAYPLTFGPACWASSRAEATQDVVEWIYAPIVRIWMRGPEPIAEALNWYCYVGAKGGWICGRPRFLEWHGPKAPRIVPHFR
jgi:hypothetical protein